MDRNTTDYLVKGWPVLTLFLAATHLESLVTPSQESRPYGFVGQALQKVIDQLTPIAENEESTVYAQYLVW